MSNQSERRADGPSPFHYGEAPLLADALIDIDQDSTDQVAWDTLLGWLRATELLNLNEQTRNQTGASPNERAWAILLVSYFICQHGLAVKEMGNVQLMAEYAKAFDNVQPASRAIALGRWREIDSYWDTEHGGLVPGSNEMMILKARLERIGVVTLETKEYVVCDLCHRVLPARLALVQPIWPTTTPVYRTVFQCSPCYNQVHTYYASGG